MAEVPDEAVEVAVEDGHRSDDDRQLRFLLYAGLFDLLVDALWDTCQDDQERDRRPAGDLERAVVRRTSRRGG